MALGGSGGKDQSLALIIKAKNRASPVLRKVSRDLNQVQTSGSKLGKGMLSVGKMAAKGLGIAGLAVAAFGAAGVKAFANFEDKMNQSLAIMGDVAPEMQAQMEDTARAIAKSTRFGADQAAEAYFYLASAGLDAQQSIAAMPQVANFAQAGMFDLARATDLATDAQSALGMTSKDAEQNLKGMTRVTDVLVKANTLANASVEQFSESLTNKAGAAIKVVGKDIEEGVAVLAAFADQGIKGAEAGTALNIVFRDLQTKAIKNEEAFRRAGVAVFDSSGEMRNMADIVGDVEDALEGMSDKNKKATLAQMGFSDKSVIFIQTLLGTSEKIREYEGALRDAAGTTKEVADKQLTSINAQFDLLKSHVADTMIGLGKDLAPAIRDDLLPALKDMATMLGDFAEAVAPAVIWGIERIADAMAGAKLLVQDFGETFGFMEAGGADLTKILREMRRGALENEDAALELANGLWALAKRAGLTAESIAILTEASEADEEQTRNAIITAINRAYALGQVSDATLALENALLRLDSADQFAAEEARFLALAHADVGEATTDLAGTTEDLGEETEDLDDEFASLVGTAYEVADGIIAADDAQKGFASTLLESLDPIFGAVEAMKRHRDLLEELPEEGERTTEQQWQLVESLLATQGALDLVDPESMARAMTLVQDALGLTADEALIFFQNLELLDGQEISVVFETQFRTTGTPVDDTYFGHRKGITRQASGGRFHAGEPILVGEEGVELLVPMGAGEIIPNDKLGGGSTTHAGMTSGGITIQNMEVNVTDDLRDPGAGRRFIESVVEKIDSYNRERAR